jgi:hypothetical protein
MMQRTYGLKLERPTPEKLSALQAQVFPAQRVAVRACIADGIQAAPEGAVALQVGRPELK